jgi:adenosine/AMP kinase
MSKENPQPVSGVPPKGLEAEPDIEWRKNFLRQIGYKL